MLSMDVLAILTLLFAGLLAGFEVAVHYGLGSPPRTLPESSQVLLRQAMILRLRILAPGLFLPTLSFGIFFTLQKRHSAAAWLDDVALALLLVWIGIRIVWTIPVNSDTLEWNPEEPPTDWRTRVERTERFHVTAAWAALAAFLAFLLSALHYR